MSGLSFDFEVPAHLIAQEPIQPRDQARLLVIERAASSLAHRHFFDLPDLLRAGDLLVLNDTRVLHARLRGCRTATGGKWEGLFLRVDSEGRWEMLCQTRGRLKPGESIAIAGGTLTFTVVGRLATGFWLMQPSLLSAPAAILQEFGEVPLPPYIRKGAAHLEDRTRYQTVFARAAGAVAAPTAGLHFTPSLFDKLAARGITWTFVTLHVGLGTFQPMQTDDPTRHVMHQEWGELSADAARLIGQHRAQGGRIIAVGTTSVRVLETAARAGTLGPWSGMTDLFIYPPYPFRAVDALITNFHFPRTTLLLMVGAFTGVELLKKAYSTAIAANYRFFSYGDAMLIV